MARHFTFARNGNGDCNGMNDGHGHGHGHGMGNGQADFARIGAIFNDATSLLVGGITDQNKGQVMQDLQAVQSKLNALIQAHPEQFPGTAAIHAQNVADQINLELQAIDTIGTDPAAPKYINDVQRDLIDIVQGDETLAALAKAHGGNGFAAVPDLLADPAQLRGNQEQTDFMRKFAADAVDIGNKAVALADGNDTAAKAALVDEIKAFDANANAFTLAQGGVYSARFNNEFAADGVNGTASRALIHGLETNDDAEVKAAAEVLAANAADVAGNMLGIGDDPPDVVQRIPAEAENLAQVGTIFNDATSQLIGGVWAGNKAAVLEDLQATQTFLEQLVANDPVTFKGRAAKDANTIIDKLGQEIAAIEGVDVAAGADNAAANQTIHDLHSQIIGIVQKDAVLRQAATEDDVTGFSPLPAPAKAAGANVAQNGDGNGHGHGNGAANHAALDPNAHSDGHALDAIANAFAHHGHHWG